MLTGLQQALGEYLRDILTIEFNWWVIIGLVAQAMFTGRFLVQWIESERQGKSVIPIAFWFFSIAGGLLLFAYAIYRRDPVFILGQAFGVFVYVRNLYLVIREQRKLSRNSLVIAKPADSIELNSETARFYLLSFLTGTVILYVGAWWLSGSDDMGQIAVCGVFAAIVMWCVTLNIREKRAIKEARV